MTAESLTFGPYELGAITASFPTQDLTSSRPAGRFSTNSRRGRGARGVQTHGQLGYEILQHFVVTVDFDEERMHVVAT